MRCDSALSRLKQKSKPSLFDIKPIWYLPLLFHESGTKLVFLSTEITQKGESNGF